MQIQRWVRGIGFWVGSGLVGLAAGLAAPAALADDFFGSGFEAFAGIPLEAAEPLTHEELGDLRGGSLGFYFSVTLSGFAEADGVLDATLDVNASLGESSGSLSFDSDAPGSTGGTPQGSVPAGDPAGPAVTVTDPTTGEAFRVQAAIGESFSGAQGVFQISQVPGNMNNVGQMLNINLVVIQATETNAQAIQARLAPLFGF